jgi:hypothetical protein
VSRGVYDDKLDVSVLLNAVVFNREADEKLVVCKNDGNVLLILDKAVSCELSLVVIVLL